jgi:hypothetical protein
MPSLAKPTYSDDKIPLELRQHLEELEQWAIGNYKDGRKDTIAFWSLKAPAIIAAAGAGVWTSASPVLGAIASVCVVIDGLHPRGMLRKTHLEAFHDIRILTNKMMTQWRTKSKEADADKMARRIVRAAEAPRDRIAAYVRNAETALGPPNSDSH